MGCGNTKERINPVKVDNTNNNEFKKDDLIIEIVGVDENHVNQINADGLELVENPEDDIPEKKKPPKLENFK